MTTFIEVTKCMVVWFVAIQLRKMFSSHYRIEPGAFDDFFAPIPLPR